MWIRSDEGTLIDTGGAILKIVGFTIMITLHGQDIRLAEYHSKEAAEAQFKAFQDKFPDMRPGVIFEFPKEY